VLLLCLLLLANVVVLAAARVRVGCVTFCHSTLHYSGTRCDRGVSGLRLDGLHQTEQANPRRHPPCAPGSGRESRRAATEVGP
jgi:hypothetical protein